MIGVVGLGRMGAAMSARLRHVGQAVLGYDVSRAAAASAGADVASSLEQVARECSTILLSLPDGAAVESVMTGQPGLLSDSASGTLIIDTTTTGPDTSVEMARAAGRHGLSYVDAPVSGGAVVAEAGQLTVMVGGATDSVDRARAVLGLIATDVFHTGGPGSGQAMKICHQLLAFGEVALLAEAMAVGARSGLSGDLMNAVFRASAGGSAITAAYGPRLAGGPPRDVRFPARLVLKDQALYASLARLAGVRSPVGDAVEALYREAVERGFGDRDASVISLLLEP